MGAASAGLCSFLFSKISSPSSTFSLHSTMIISVCVMADQISIRRKQVKALLKVYRRYKHSGLPEHEMLRAFPLPFVLAVAEHILAALKPPSDPEFVHFVARVLTTYSGTSGKGDRVDSAIAALYLAVFCSPKARMVYLGQAWAVFNAYAQDEFGCGLRSIVSTGTKEEQLQKIKTLVQARRRDIREGSNLVRQDRELPVENEAENAQDTTDMSDQYNSCVAAG